LVATLLSTGLDGPVGQEAAWPGRNGVILWVVLSIIAVVVLVVVILWIWAIATGGKYM
jgi:cell division septal protein FtsQ